MSAPIPPPPLQRIALFLLAGAVLVGLSVGATYIFYHWHQSGFKLWDPPPARPAAPDCGQRIDQYFGSRLVLRYIDHHSSRYQPATGDYAKFFRVDAYLDAPGADFSASTPAIQGHLVKCVVADHSGLITAFEVYRL